MLPSLKDLRHPDQPERPLQAENLFIMEHKAEFRRFNPMLSRNDVKHILRNRFSNLNAEQRAVYQEKELKFFEEYWPKLEKFWYTSLLSIYQPFSVNLITFNSSRKDHPGNNSLTLLAEIEKMKKLD